MLIALGPVLGRENDVAVARLDVGVGDEIDPAVAMSANSVSCEWIVSTSCAATAGRARQESTSTRAVWPRWLPTVSIGKYSKRGKPPELAPHRRQARRRPSAR